MLLVKKPTKKGMGDAFKTIRRLAENAGTEFSDLTLEVEVARAEAALHGLDVCGYLAHTHFAMFVAVAMSIENPDLEAGHQWLHTWLETAGIGASCGAALAASQKVASMFLACESQGELMALLRGSVSEETDFPKMVASLSEDLSESVAEEQDSEAYLTRLLDDMHTVFTDFATADNDLAKVAQLGEALRDIAPAKGLGAYLQNGLAALNWGLVGEGFADAFIGNRVLNEKFQFVAMAEKAFEAIKGLQSGGGHFGPHHSSGPQHSSGEGGRGIDLRDLQALFGNGDDDDDDE